MAPPSTSRAWTFTSRGPPADVLFLDPARKTPTLPPALPLPKDAPNPEEWILVRTAYAALNPGGLFHVALLPAFARAKTAVPELDLSGVVVDRWAPDGTGARFKVGDRIAAFLPVAYTWPTGEGALKEYVAFPAKYAVPVPAGVGLREAGAVLLAGLCARALVRAGEVREGGRVLVNAAAGGIGSLAIQMVRRAVGPGGFVVGVCSGGNVELVKGLGADEVRAYSPLHAELTARYGGKPFDVVIDAIGIQELYVRCGGFLKPEGTYAAIGLKPARHSLPALVGSFLVSQANALWPRAEWLGGTGRKWTTVTVMGASVEEMEDVMGMVGRGEVRVVVGSEFGMEDAVKAYEVMAGGHAKGKVVVKVDGEAE
ncbi:zinc alcohol dehydrogenase [Plectosphaerella cucumerina]|uniref:Zinc alcohol dehydrogenase n=1 Tax=Plectosphaerella cucumerina TaxID=40658 RepID=A0A8K0X8B9_9PEZI|nr:zinc alcohol dehydrogenase [Plectosphaerella cucumerina]